MGLLSLFRRKKKTPSAAPGLKEIFQGFQQVLAANNEALAIMGQLEEKLASSDGFDLQFLRSRIDSLDQHLADLVAALQRMSAGRWQELENGRIRIKEALKQRLEEARGLEAGENPQLRQSLSPEKLRTVVDLVMPLTLVDRRSQDFRPENCRTYHDITRLAHEKAIQGMFGLMDGVAEGRFPALRLLKLDTALPLNLHLMDLGGGLATHVTPVPPASIISVPMRALWRGISHPGISWAGPVPVSVGGFLHVLAQTAIRPPERFWDKTYAIVAANYVNYSCRLGFHFATVDSLCGPVPDDNFINFAFKGGAADEPRRIRRAKLIAIVLERLGFELEVFKDVVRARFRKRPAAENEERLDLLGRLMAYVRQMDMLMSDDSKIYLLAERFLSGHYERPGEEEGEEQE
jgi:pyruvate,water dikinase